MHIDLIMSFAADIRSEVSQCYNISIFIVGHIGFSNMAISISTTVKIPHSDSLW